MALALVFFWRVAGPGGGVRKFFTLRVRIHKDTDYFKGGLRAKIYQIKIFCPPPWKNPVSAPDRLTLYHAGAGLA